MIPAELARRMASLQQWLEREIATRQAALYPERSWPMPRAIADGTVVIDPSNQTEFPSTNVNHVEHLGTAGLASERILAEIIELYRSAGVSRFFVYVSPSDQSAELGRWLESSGMVRTVELSVLWRPAQFVGRVECDFELRVALQRHADLLREVVASEGDVFGTAAGTVDLLGTPGCYTMLATRADAPAATGSLYVQGKLGYLGNGKTVEAFRNHGAQSALIAARLGLASALGCTDVASETYRFLETSYSNLEKSGFTELYTRPIYRWDA